MTDSNGKLLPFNEQRLPDRCTLVHCEGRHTKDSIFCSKHFELFQALSQMVPNLQFYLPDDTILCVVLAPQTEPPREESEIWTPEKSG